MVLTGSWTRRSLANRSTHNRGPEKGLRVSGERATQAQSLQRALPGQVAGRSLIPEPAKLPERLPARLGRPKSLEVPLLVGASRPDSSRLLSWQQSPWYSFPVTEAGACYLGQAYFSLRLCPLLLLQMRAVGDGQLRLS